MNKVILSNILVTVVVLFLFSIIHGEQANGVNINGCSSDASTDISQAYSIVSNNLDAYLNEWHSKLSSINVEDQNKVTNNINEYKERFRKKWPKTKIKCKDDKDRCVKMGGDDAWVSYEFKLKNFKRKRGNEMKVCYYKVAQNGGDICSLVGLEVHEMAHLVGVPKQKGHDKNPASVRNTDAVYLFGDSAADLCRNQASTGLITNSTLSGQMATNLSVGDDCSFDSQCASGHCKGPNGGQKCTCKNDAQCSPGICKEIKVSTPVGDKELKQCLSPCEAALHRNIAWDYKNHKKWHKDNTEELCQSVNNSTEPALCFERVMFSGINWGGGTTWSFENAIDLCGGTLDSNATISCFEQEINNGVSWNDAIAVCS